LIILHYSTSVIVLISKTFVALSKFKLYINIKQTVCDIHMYFMYNVVFKNISTKKKKDKIIISNYICGLCLTKKKDVRGLYLYMLHWVCSVFVTYTLPLHACKIHVQCILISPIVVTDDVNWKTFKNNWNFNHFFSKRHLHKGENN
jgi:hypothetical protein